MASRLSPRLVLLEASKVRSYHAPLMDGLIRAYATAGLGRRWGRPRLLAHPSFFDNLSPAARAAVDYVPIPVVDQDRRHLIRKSLLEAWVICRAMLKLGRDDILLVTTVIPSAMPLVELWARLLRRRKVVVLQHNELEAAFDEPPPRFASFGYFNLLWHRVRRGGSTIALAVLDRFIAQCMLERYAGSVDPDALFVIPLPMIAADDPGPPAEGPVKCCFVGFDTRHKGFAIFERLAGQFPNLEFRVIGGGVDRDLGTGAAVPVPGNDDFLAALARCHFAIMPYTGGYACSMSAAATDAVARGLHLLATPRGCFVALAEAFGPDTVTLCEDEAAIAARLADGRWLRRQMARRGARIAGIERSRYGLAGVGAALAEMIERVGAEARS